MQRASPQVSAYAYAFADSRTGTTENFVRLASYLIKCASMTWRGCGSWFVFGVYVFASKGGRIVAYLMIVGNNLYIVQMIMMRHAQTTQAYLPAIHNAPKPTIWQHRRANSSASEPRGACRARELFVLPLTADIASSLVKLLTPFRMLKSLLNA